jgi:hypothetical protein
MEKAKNKVLYNLAFMMVILAVVVWGFPDKTDSP